MKVKDLKKILSGLDQNRDLEILANGNYCTLDSIEDNTIVQTHDYEKEEDLKEPKLTKGSIVLEFSF
jgi:hypothetical protein